MNVLTEIQLAASAVFTVAKQLGGAKAAQTRVAIVGGLAVTRLTKHRRTFDVDLFFGGALSPPQLKRDLQRADPAFRLNFEAINGITYRSPTSKITTSIDLLDVEATRFEPRAQLLSEFESSRLPFAHRDDLISMKLFAATERQAEEKRLQDINDILTLLHNYPGPLHDVSDLNKSAIRDILPQIVTYGQGSLEWWKKQLGL